MSTKKPLADKLWSNFSGTVLSSSLTEQQKIWLLLRMLQIIKKESDCCISTRTELLKKFFANSMTIKTKIDQRHFSELQVVEKYMKSLRPILVSLQQPIEDYLVNNCAETLSQAEINFASRYFGCSDEVSPYETDETNGRKKLQKVFRGFISRDAKYHTSK